MVPTLVQPGERKRKRWAQQVQQSGAGGGRDGVDMDGNTGINAAKLSLKCFTKTKKSFVIACRDCISLIV